VSTKKQLIIIAVAALMLSVSLLGSVGLVAAITANTLTITANTTTPAANQSFTLSGTLTAGTTPTPGKTITLLRAGPSGTWGAVGTTTTASNGSYTFTRSESQGVYHYYAYFAGDTTTYSTSTSPTVILTVGNLQQSAISIFATNYTFAVNQSYTVYGFLQNAVSGAFLTGQPIELTIQSPSGQLVNMSATTASNGSYTFTRSESSPGSYKLTVSFSNTSSGYLASGAMRGFTVGNPVPTTLSLNITNSNPSVNQSFTISGYLTDINGTPLSGEGLYLDARLPAGNWVPEANTNTDSNGHYSVTFSDQNPGQYYYEVIFWGDGPSASVVSTLEVAVGTLQPTNTSMNASVNNPGVGQPFTLSGTLTDANGSPLAGKEIDLYDSVVGQPAQGGGIFETRYTDQNGSYAFVLNESTSGYHKYIAQFIGDQTHADSQATVTLTVGTLASTTLTITANTTKPAANQSFTLSGTLTAGTTPVPGKTITLLRAGPSGTWSAAGTTTTASNGSYTFTRSESQGVYHYYAYFAGDPSYSTSTSPTVTLTVGTLASTTLTITANTTKPAANQSFTLSGTLTAGTTPVPGKTITLLRAGPSGTWSAAGTTTTASNGSYTFTRSESQGVYHYYAYFAGDTTTYSTSTSPTLSVSVGA
jgi:hypothetical protein